jgi:hypothetical protein
VRVEPGVDPRQPDPQQVDQHPIERGGSEQRRERVVGVVEDIVGDRGQVDDGDDADHRGGLGEQDNLVLVGLEAIADRQRQADAQEHVARLDAERRRRLDEPLRHRQEAAAHNLGDIARMI